MRKIYHSVRFILFSTLVSGGLALATTACVNNEYDLNKEIEEDIHVGGEITAPLGSTKKTYLSDVLDPEDIEYLEELDGEYKISMKDRIEIDIDQITDQAIEIPAFKQDIDPFTFEFEKPEIPAIDLAIPAKTIEFDPSQSAGDVDLGDAKFALNESRNLGIELGSGLMSPSFPIPIPSIDIPFTTYSTSVDFTFGENIACPKEVQSISNIKIGSTVTIAFDISAISNRFADDFTFDMESVDIVFPEGFVINGGSNAVHIRDIVATDNNIIEKQFTVTGYDKVIGVNNGVFEPIGGPVSVNYADHCTVGGTLIPNSESSTAIKVIVSSDDLSAKDLDITIADVEIPIDDINIGEELVIDVPKEVESIESITLDAATNTLAVDISSVQLPEGLNVANTNLNLLFPRSLFNISEHIYDNDYTKLVIPTADIINGNGFSGEVQIHSINLASTPIVDGKMTINPGLILKGATIAVSGTVSYSDYNAFVGEPMKITASVETPGNAPIEIADADIKVSSDVFACEIEAFEKEIAPDPVVIPAEIERIDSLHFTHAIMAPINISVALDGVDAELAFDNLTIELPKFLRIRDAKSNGIDADNVLVLNDTFTVEKDDDPYTDDYGVHTFNRTLYVEALDFSMYDFDAMTSENAKGEIELAFKDKIKVSGGLKLTGKGGVGSPSISLADLKDEISADISFDLDEDMVLEKVYGVVNPVIECEPEVIDLKELADAFDGELTATLAGTSIEITVSNSLSVPVVIDRLELQPSKDGIDLVAAKLPEGEVIKIEAAKESGEATETTILIVGDDNTADGAECVKIENLNSLLNNLPDKVVFNYNVATYSDSETNHMIDLTKDKYAFSVDYAVNVPLAFEELNIDYSLELEDLGETIESFADYVQALELELKGTNTLPISLTISELTPLDTDGNEISSIPSLIDSEYNKLAANGTSVIKVKLDANGDDLKRVDKLRIGVEASIDHTAGGAAILPDQYFQFEVSARIPDGVVVTSDMY